MEKVVTIRSLKDNHLDVAFWKSKTPAERIAAIELLRQHYLSFLKNPPQIVQRVFAIVDLHQR
jgi:hypothetical protein